MCAVKYLPPSMSVEETDKPLARSAFSSGSVRGIFSAANASLPAVATAASRMRAPRESFAFLATSISESRVRDDLNEIMVSPSIGISKQRCQKPCCVGMLQGRCPQALAQGVAISAHPSCKRMRFSGGYAGRANAGKGYRVRQHTTEE